MLLTRTWRCDPLNIELQNWLFQVKALANCKAFSGADFLRQWAKMIHPVTHKKLKVWSTEYWTSKLVISRESLGQLQGFSGADLLRQWAKMIHPMLLTRTWRCDPHNIELQNWLFQGKALANCKAFLELISWGNRQKWYTLCYSQEHEGLIHLILNFKIGYFKGKPVPTARLLWSRFPEAMGKIIHPMLLTRTWRCDPHNIEL